MLSMTLLQQLLPFTVLKRLETLTCASGILALQQLLPFTVLKPTMNGHTKRDLKTGCNSSYRLRY